MCIVFLLQEELSRVICPATFESIYFFSSWNTWRNSCTMLMKAALCPCLCLQRYTKFNQHAVETNSFHSIFMTKFSLLFGQSFLQARISTCSEMNRSFKPKHFLQTVRTFFRTNKGTCLEWLSRVRSSVIKIALHSGMPAMAIRQCHQLLQEMKDNNTLQVRTITGCRVYMMLMICTCTCRYILG